MLIVSNLSLQFGKRVLFDDVNIKFTKGNCYGIIGANGVGKSTFLKILSGDIEEFSGHIQIETGKRMSVLRQNHHIFDHDSVIETVIMGNKILYKIKQEIDLLYNKPNFSEEDGIKAGNLGIAYEEIGGWNAETDAATLLSSLGIHEEYHKKLIRDLDVKIKIRVLLAQALFGTPDILILDEPTNDLDTITISWLEDFLGGYENTVIVVSHDRHFLDSVCTHICDLDFSKIQIFTGNYSFWYQASQIATQHRSQQYKKVEEKRKELKEFIRRFSSNLSKSRQATARKKMLDKLQIDVIQPSSRRYPAICFEQKRKAGSQILEIDKLSTDLDKKNLFSNLSLQVNRGDKIAVLSKNTKSISAFYEIISDMLLPKNGSFVWGITTKRAFLPEKYDFFFKSNLNLVNWLRQYADTEEDRHEEYIRGFLGKMLFSGEQALKKVCILSGGEKMRCMLSRMMLLKANVLILYEPTNHLDLESIIALNQALRNFEGTLLISSQDHELLQTTCNRIIEIGPQGSIDRQMQYDEYLKNLKIEELRKRLYIPAKI